MEKVNWKDLLGRAMWTFIEGFLVALPVTFSMGMDGMAWKSALFSASMAGLSALKTFVLEVIKIYKLKGVTEE